MLELFLVRHGETTGNVWRVFYGKEDYPLTQKGIIEAQDAASILQDTNPLAIYTSPLSRTLETARKIAAYHPGMAFEVEEDLREMFFGLWEGLTHYEISERFPAAWKAWSDDWWSYKIPQGESASEMYARNTACVDAILRRHDHGQVILVSHQGPLRGIISHLLGFGKDGYWRFQLEPGRITKITLQDGYGVLTLLNG